MEGMTEGRIVHYVIAGHEYPGAQSAKGQHRPALVVRAWHAHYYVNALLFLDGSNDGWQQSSPPVVWLTSIEEGVGEGKWHDPKSHAAAD